MYGLWCARVCCVLPVHACMQGPAPTFQAVGHIGVVQVETRGVVLGGLRARVRAMGWDWLACCCAAVCTHVPLVQLQAVCGWVGAALRAALRASRKPRNHAGPPRTWMSATVCVALALAIAPRDNKVVSKRLAVPKAPPQCCRAPARALAAAAASRSACQAASRLWLASRCGQDPAAPQTLRHETAGLSEAPAAGHSTTLGRVATAFLGTPGGNGLQSCCFHARIAGHATRPAFVMLCGHTAAAPRAHPALKQGQCFYTQQCRTAST